MAEAEVEKYVRYFTEVQTMQEVWTFVMDYLERLGSDAPTIQITPYIEEDEETEEEVQMFSVVVSGIPSES